MKTRYKIWSVVAFALFTMLPCEAQDHLIFSCPENTPIMQGMPGLRILKEAYSRLGIDFELQLLPIERALVVANEGETDGDLLRFTGLEQKYPNLVKVPFPLQYLEIVVYAKDKEFAVEGWHSLAPYTIGIVKGFKLAEVKTKGMNVETVTTVTQAFLKLNDGRNDVIVDLRRSRCKLKGLNVSDIKILEPSLEQIPMYHYLHIRHQVLAKKLEAELTLMVQEGVVKTIQEQANLDSQDFCGQ